ncbi:unnamed protein product [Tetraodon nigroviridis]|uniref:Cyclin-D-binding Myb-like transcription factor 1 n=1 Tax=Tetraodon nigroviridis TaxID=99883 RepID=Q4RGU4_TETNG|nr:unnamed protein product [Tetraodon nigroviridis]
MMSSTPEQDGQEVALETVKSVTLTQDKDGSIILHCPTADETSQPVQKKLRLSADQHKDSEAPHFSMVTLPMSEGEEGFEVTMTATTDDDLCQERVAQIQVLMGGEDEDSPSPSQNAEVSLVSQAWFTTKEDKDTLTNKGHKWKQGMWSKEEIGILINNIERYVKGRGIDDPAEIIFEMSKEERKDFYRSVALGLNRPLFAVYRRVLRMYDNRNHVGKYTPEEIEKLKALKEKHGNDWATIGAALGRSASSVKDRCRLMKDTCNTGKWSEEEEKRLAEVVYEMAGASPGSAVTVGVSWAMVANKVRTRSEKQCRSKWLNYLNWKHSGGTEWMKEDDLRLVQRSVTTETLLQERAAVHLVLTIDLGAGGGGRERNPVGGPGGRVEQRPLASVAPVQMVEHQETSVQSQGHPLQRSSQRSPGTHVVHTNIVRSGKSVLFVLAADPTDAGGGEQQPRLQLRGLPADPGPDPSADHSPGVRLLSGSRGRRDHHSELWSPADLRDPAVISPAAHWHSRDLLPPDHIQPGPALQSRQQRHGYLGDGLISCTPRTHYPPQSVGRGQEEQLEATSLLEGVTETQEPMTDGFGDKELSSSSVEVPVVHSGSTVLIVSPPNISSTLTDPILENQEGSD